MRRNKTIVLALLLCSLSISSMTSVLAQAPKQASAADHALKKAQGMLRLLNQEKAALQTENSQLLEQVKNLEKEIKQLQQEGERYRIGTENLLGVKSTLESNLQQAHKREQALVQKQDAIITQARQIQSDNQLLLAAVQEREQLIDECTDKNTNLVQVNQELLDKYQQKSKSFWQKLGELEPLTGIGNVTTENLVESYQYKLEDLSFYRKDEEDISQ